MAPAGKVPVFFLVDIEKYYNLCILPRCSHFFCAFCKKLDEIFSAKKDNSLRQILGCDG